MSVDRNVAHEEIQVKNDCIGCVHINGLHGRVVKRGDNTSAMLKLRSA